MATPTTVDPATGQLLLGRYTGAAYPFGPTPNDTLGPKPDINVVYTSIVNIITTPKYSYPPNPDLGSVVPSLVFELNDEVTRSVIRHFVVKDLSEQEPRIVVQHVNTDVPDETTIIVTIGFSIVGDPKGTVYNTPITFPREG